MLKTCEYCGTVFNTEYPTKIYCRKKCADLARFERDESYYEFPHAADAEPIFSFECANCGKKVTVYSRYDQRIKFCCGICAKKYKETREKIRLAKRHGNNIGISGGMSLSSLIHRESRSVDREKVIEVKICPICRKKFEVTKRHKKYCSTECSFQGEYGDKLEKWSG